jgi:hypothetical protein
VGNLIVGSHSQLNKDRCVHYGLYTGNWSRNGTIFVRHRMNILGSVTLNQASITIQLQMCIVEYIMP